MISSSQKVKKGFTLLEVMLSIAVFVLLITSAFTLVGATTELMAEVSEVQNEAAVRMRFIESCRSAFESMTAESDIEFYFVDRGGGKVDTYLSIVNAPEAFDFGMNLHDEIERVVIASEVKFNRIRSGVYYMTAADYETARQTDFGTIESDYVELVPSTWTLRWRFYDGDTATWRDTLDGNFESSLIELTFQLTRDSPPITSVFWHLSG